MKKNIILIGLAMVSLGISLSTISTNANAKTINYGSIAKDQSLHGVHVKFRFNKKLSHANNNPDNAYNVAVYDTKITNYNKNSVRFYFSKLYFSNQIYSYAKLSTFKVNRPHKYVVVKPNHTKIVKNSFRDSDNAASSLYMPKKKDQDIIQYYEHNDYYLANVNTMHHKSKGYGWHPTWTWSK